MHVSIYSFFSRRSFSPMAKSQSRNFFLFHIMFFYTISFSSELQPELESGSPCFASDPYDSHTSKLEDLVRNLERIVMKLDSNPPECKINDPSVEKFNRDNQSPLPKDLDVIKHDSDQHISDDSRSGLIENKDTLGRPVLVTKYSPFWSERFHFISAVRLDYPASSMNVLPFRDGEGMSKYVVVGDQRGMIYVLLRNGDVSLDFQTKSSSTITSMLSYISVHKNDTLFITGHENGDILMHRLWEKSNGDDWNSLEIQNIIKFPSYSGENPSYTASAVIILEIHHVGRVRYILSSDYNGRITVFNENGMIHGSAFPSRKPLAFLKQRLLFLTELGAGSLDLRTMKIKETECEGLNNSIVTNYVFDTTERSKAYGFTSKNDIIHVLLLGDTSNFKCKVRSKKKVDMDQPLFFHTIKGYLLIVNLDKAYVYNVSSQHYIRSGSPRLLFSAALEFIRQPFLTHQTSSTPHQNPRKTTPLVVSDRDKLIVLTLGDGYVGLYRSNLPVFKGEVNSMLWTSPVLFFVLFLFGAWQFFAKKKETLTSWGSDDMFVPSTPDGPGSDRPNRFISAAPYRPDPFRDHSPRISSVVANFRAATEMKFRGSNSDSTNFQKRRDGCES